jgi:hypothetical protein
MRGVRLRESVETANLIFPAERTGGIGARRGRLIAQHQRGRREDDTKDAGSRIGLAILIVTGFAEIVANTIKMTF